MKFSGIDLHSNNSVVVVSDEEDRIVYRKRLPNNLEQIRAALAPYRDELAGVVVESTYNWYFLVDGLMDAGYRVHLANTTAIKKYEGLKYSGDFADAAYLAQLLRLGLLPEGYIYPREERAGRDRAVQAHAQEVVAAVRRERFFERQGRDVFAIDQHAPTVGHEQPQDQLEDGRFATTCLTNESDSLSGGNNEADVLQSWLALIICERDSVKFDKTLAQLERLRIWHVSDCWLCLEELKQTEERDGIDE